MPRSQDTSTLERSARAGAYASLLVHVEPGIAATGRVEAAARLARSFDARLIGLGAEALEPLPPTDPYSGLLTAEWLAMAYKQIEADLTSAEAAFRRDAAGCRAEWRQVQETPARALARVARAADLIVVGGAPVAASASFRKADPADVVLTAGRPVLVAPAGGGHLSGRCVMVAWKDTRESRRALGDAMPFLSRADEVVIHAVCAEDAVDAAQYQVQDVAESLKLRGIAARGVVTTAPDASVAEELNTEAAQVGADLIVAGAYGHSRLAEWTFGGVTRDLLRDPRRFLLLSH